MPQLERGAGGGGVGGGRPAARVSRSAPRWCCKSRSGRDALLHGLERLGLKPSAEREVTVLVVDDDPSAIDLLAAQLRQNRYAVLRAQGGRAGIELARRHRPDLIALDLEMPEVNGFDVVEALKSRPDTARIPIVVVTAQNLSAAERDRLNGHISEIVGKSQFSRRTVRRRGAARVGAAALSARPKAAELIQSSAEGLNSGVADALPLRAAHPRSRAARRTDPRRRAVVRSDR